MPAYAAGSARSSILEADGDFAYSDPVANPVDGMGVIMSPFSGPTDSPFDAMRYNADDPSLKEANDKDASTGALSTGIGFGPTSQSPGIDTLRTSTLPSTAGNFNDNYQPGITLPDGTDAPDARLLAIGGGHMADIDIETELYGDPDPYNAQPLMAFGNGGARDATNTGFGMKVVTAAGSVANGAAIETGFVNRSGAAMTTGKSQFGVNTTEAAAIAPLSEE